MNLEICANNLGTGQIAYGKVHNLEDVKNVVNPTGENDVETELIETDIQCVTQDNLIQFLELVKKFPEMKEQDIAYLLYNEINVDEVINGDRFYEYIDAVDKVTAFKIYFKENYSRYELDEFSDIIAFINWEEMCTAWESQYEFDIFDLGSTNNYYDNMPIHRFLFVS